MQYFFASYQFVFASSIAILLYGCKCGVMPDNHHEPGYDCYNLNLTRCARTPRTPIYRSCSTKCVDFFYEEFSEWNDCVEIDANICNDLYTPIKGYNCTIDGLTCIPGVDDKPIFSLCKKIVLIH